MLVTWLHVMPSKIIKAAFLSNKAQSSAIVFQKLWGEVISIADEVHPNVDMQICAHVLVQFEQK